MVVLQVAVAVVTLVGGSLGVASWFQTRRRDTTAARATAQTVAAEVTDAGLKVLHTAMAQQSEEIADLRERLDDLTHGLARCEAEKAALAVRIRELEEAR